MEKSSDVVTKVVVVDAVGPNPDPLMVKRLLPKGVARLVVTVSTEAPVAGFGLKLPFAPAGKPLTLKLTALVNPLAGITDTL